MCSCGKNKSGAPKVYQVVKEGAVVGSYSTQVEAEASAQRNGGAVVAK